MPPKRKFTKEEIIDAAFRLVREEGEKAMTAREVGKRLGTSSSPIFTVFRDMNELGDEVKRSAKACFDEYMAIAENYRPAYKMRGIQWVRFATREPELFKLLFMKRTDDGNDFDEAMSEIPFGRENDIAIIMRDYNADRKTAEHLFRQMWVYTYGMCVLSATGVCSFDDGEISQRLGEIFCGMIYVLQSGNETASSIPVERCNVAGSAFDTSYPDLSTGK